MAILAVLLLPHHVRATASEPVTLYYWGWDSDVLGMDVIQEFERMHDGRDGKPPIKVIMGQSAVWSKDSDFQRLLCGVVGGDPPDVVWYGRNSTVAWASRGAFLSLQPFLERDLAERTNDPLTLRKEMFWDHCWTEASYNGELYSLPADTDVRVLFYNLDVFEKHADALKALGCVDPKDPTRVGPPQTWDQLRECVKLLSKFDTRGRLQDVGYIPNYGNAWLCLYAWLNGGEFLSPDGRTCTMNSPPVVDALAYMTELYDLMGGVEQVRAFETSLPLADLDPFMTGRVAMKIDVDGFMSYVAWMRRDMRFGVALPPAPAGKPSVSWSGGWSWVIPKNSKHPEEAWEFVKFMASRKAYQIRNDAMAQITRANGRLFVPQISARRDIAEWAMEHYLYSDPTIEDKFKEGMRVCLEALPRARFRPLSPVGQLWWNEHVSAMDAGLYKKYDPNDIRRNAQLALDRGTAVVQAELDRIYQPKPYPVLRWQPIVLAYLVIVAVASLMLYLYFDRRMQARGYFRKEFRAGYTFASPWFIGFVIFGGGPILFSLIMSFCDYDVFTAPKFVGLENYTTLLTDDPLFYKSLWNTIFMVIGVPLGMAVSLAIAVLLNYQIRGIAVYRTFFYLPAIMPAVAASILWIWIFNPHQGILNMLLGKIGIAGPAWLQDTNWSKPALIVMGLWGAGGGMIVWLAGLKGISESYY
ncbi:MAG: extracellular solute-binding protein, partial [Candidatus Hydrogenedentes bacterium]|nr:extracellular solute-binding protein [Candidatus Hydrogenedentota bacterium]